MSVMSKSESENDVKKPDDSLEDAPLAPCTHVSDKHNAHDATSASQPSAKESVFTQESKTQTPEPPEALKTPSAEAEGPPSGMLNNPVTFTVTSASMTPTQNAIVSSVPVRSATPLVVGARMVSTAGASGQTSASHPVGLTVTSNQIRPPAVTKTPLRAAIVALPRTSQQNVTVPRSPQTTSLQLPANFQIPQGLC